MKVIGIDPDKTDCGICELVGGSISDLYTLSPSKFIEDIKIFKDKGYIFAIENCEQINTIYAKNRRANPAVQSKIAQSVGMVKGVFSVLHECLKLQGCEIILVPVGAGKAWKNSAEQFRKDTGYEGRTNADKRDAAAIAFYAERIIKRNILTGQSSQLTKLVYS